MYRRTNLERTYARVYTWQDSHGVRPGSTARDAATQQASNASVQACSAALVPPLRNVATQIMTINGVDTSTACCTLHEPRSQLPTLLSQPRADSLTHSLAARRTHVRTPPPRPSEVLRVRSSFTYSESRASRLHLLDASARRDPTTRMTGKELRAHPFWCHAPRQLSAGR